MATSSKDPTSLYKVLLLNDDMTPMEFIVELLIIVFHKTREEAMQIAVDMHQKGQAPCGIYSLEIAETKSSELIDCARRERHPLQCRIEKVER